MKKKALQRKSQSTWFIASVAVIAFFLLLGKSGWKSAQKPRVLGISQLFADKGGDSGGGGHDSGGDRGGGGTSGGGGSSSSSNTGSSGGSNVTPLPSPKQENPEKHSEQPKQELETRKKPNEIETEAENENIKKLNEELKNENIHVGSSSGGFTVKHGQVEAETHFPLSVNVATHELTVTTPAGIKTVTVLPDQAVQNLLSRNIFDRIETNEASPGAQKVELTEVENQPVFAVKGLNDKRLLGFIPVSVRKTAFVSAQNGGVVRTDETPVNRLLDIFSF